MNKGEYLSEGNGTNGSLPSEIDELIGLLGVRQLAN